MLEPVELFEVTATQSRQLPRPCGREPESHAPLVVRVLLSADETSLRRSIDETDRAVVPQQQRTRHIADRRAPTIVMSPYGEQQLMLSSRDPHRLGLLLAPMDKATQLGAELQQLLVLTVGHGPRRSRPGPRNGPGSSSENLGF